MLKLPVAVLRSPMYTWPTTIKLASNTCMMDFTYTKTKHPPPALVRKDIAWTNTTRHPPHPPMAPYTPVNLQSPTSHPSSKVIVPSVKINTVHRGRDSGGILVWHKEDLAKHISIIILGKFHCWLKLNSQIGISTTDTYLCAIYIPPAESPYHDEEYLNNIHIEISRPRETCCCVETLTQELELNLITWIQRAMNMSLAKNP
ncbi:hypothetical protein QQF64_013581 [Cirrhinus molitorella]|uniref:Uncharacterized protein n=1 Tax=Cirrhinus molitorella TaxID=172907 RepID=A0ABR3LT84_9TELE